MKPFNLLTQREKPAHTGAQPGDQRAAYRIQNRGGRLRGNNTIRHTHTGNKGLVVSFTFTAAGIDTLDIDDYAALGTLIPDDSGL